MIQFILLFLHSKGETSSNWEFGSGKLWALQSTRIKQQKLSWWTNDGYNHNQVQGADTLSSKGVFRSIKFRPNTAVYRITRRRGWKLTGEQPGKLERIGEAVRRSKLFPDATGDKREWRRLIYSALRYFGGALISCCWETMAQKWNYALSNATWTIRFSA